MADVVTDDKTTIEQSNSIEPEDQTDDSVTNNQDDDQGDDSGNADDQSGADQGGSDDDTEGSKKDRGEVRHERYIDKLAGEIRQSNAQETRYTEEIFSSKPYQPIEYKPDAEYDPKDLEADRKTVAENARNEGLVTGLNQGSSQVQKEMWLDRFDIDSERVSNKWDELNTESEAYKPQLEAYLVQQYIAFTGMTKDAQGRVNIERPNIRFRDFVDAEMKNLETYAASKNADSSKNIVKQASRTGVRPNGQARVSKGNHGFDPNDPAGSVARMTKKQYFELGGKEASDKYLSERGLA